MALTKYKLGELIERHNIRNGANGTRNVKGISTSKQFREPSSKVNRNELENYKVCKPRQFAFVQTTHNEKVLAYAFNDTDEVIVVSSVNEVFSVRDEDLLCPEYLCMYFNRSEFDRYARFHSWGSARETFSWEDMCDIDIDLPPIDIQRKYVRIYLAMTENQRAYERGLEDLRIVCDGYIEDLRRKMPCEKIGAYIRPYNVKNSDGAITLEQGINVNKQFITPQRSNSNLLGRKIVRHGMFAYCTQLNNERVAIAYRDGEDCVVSSVYDVFEIVQPDKLIAQYLMLWLIRAEFGRFVYWAAEGSAYEFLNYDNLANYKIPIPSIEIQRSIADIYNVCQTRKSISERLKAHIKNICPVLIKGAIEEAQKEEA